MSAFVSNMKRVLSGLVTASVVLGMSANAIAQGKNNQCAEDAMLVFDGSGSMAEMGYNGLNTPRIFDARDALRTSLPQITEYRRLGLITYGPGPNDACSNVQLRLRPIPNAASAIIKEVDELTPAGKTPLTVAVQSAADVLDYLKKPAIVVLVTDGKETCGGATCRIAAELAAQAHNITVHVIGFKVRAKSFNWQGNDDAGYENGRTVARCLADLTGGLYVSAESTEDLVEALQKTLACPLIGKVDEIEPLVLRG